MKRIILLMGLLFSIIAMSQTKNPNYDADLAKKYGADDYGMKAYILVMLKTGSNTDTVKSIRNESFRGHMNNINRLVKEEKLILAGPLGKNKQTYRGIFILNVKTITEAEELLKTDPAFKAGYLAADFFEWYGAAALSAYLEDSDKVWKINP